MNKMYEYEIECSSKNICIEPRFPKNKVFNQLSLNSQTANMFCIKLKEFSNLVGQTKGGESIPCFSNTNSVSILVFPIQ